MYCYAVEREFGALLLLSSEFHVAVIVLCLFLTVSWVGLWSAVVAFPGNTHIFFVLSINLGVG